MASFWLAVRVGQKSSDYKHEKRMREYAEEEAQSWADKPNTDDDFTDRLLERIKQKNKTKNKR